MNILAPKPEYVQNLSAILRGMVQELPIEDQANSIERAIPRILTQVRQTYVNQFVVLVFSYEMAMILRGAIQGSPVLSNIVELAPTSDGQSGFSRVCCRIPCVFPECSRRKNGWTVDCIRRPVFKSYNVRRCIPH